MFEMPPFAACPQCGRPDLGVLSIGGRGAVYRCRSCRYSQQEALPVPDKRVIYLDQFAASEIFKTKQGTRKVGAPHEALWREVAGLVQRLVMLQQAVFPLSVIHQAETALFRDGQALHDAMELFGGDVGFVDHATIENAQLYAMLEAHLTQAPPVFDLAVDRVLMGRRNEWLDRIHISVNRNVHMMADGFRADRDEGDRMLTALFAQWHADKVTFQQALDAEAKSYGRVQVQALLREQARIQSASQSGDVDTLLSAALSVPNARATYLMSALQARGYQGEDAFMALVGFYMWPDVWDYPASRISAYMFAALAAGAGAGRKTPPSRGMMNDIQAISTYAPYVDAILVDQECAALLEYGPVKRALNYKARVFSLRNGDEFVEYLRDLERSTPDLIRAMATRLYQLK